MNKILTSILLLVLVTILSSCGWRNVRGNGTSTTISRDVGTFKGVKTAGSFDLYITQGESNSIRIEAEENLLNYIITENNGGDLVVKVRKGVRLRPRKDIKIFVTAPVYRKLSIAGSGNIISNNKLSSSELILFNIAGSGEVRIAELEAPRIKVNIAGSGEVRIEGQTREAEYKIAGSGDIRCGNLKAEQAKVNLAGSGTIWLFASQELDVRLAGGGDVHYKGDPVTVKQKIAGSGNLIKE